MSDGRNVIRKNNKNIELISNKKSYSREFKLFLLDEIDVELSKKMISEY